MPEETVDPGLLEQTKNRIRKLVAEIADLAESDMQPSEFYVEFLNRANEDTANPLATMLRRNVKPSKPG